MNNERDFLDIITAYYQKKFKESKQKKISNLISPLYVGFKITELCNQHCKHCWSGKSTSVKSYEEIEKAMIKISAFNIIHFTITGGEPLVHKDFLKILDKAIELFPIVEIFTNGQNLNENIICLISKKMRRNDFIQISLDGLRETYKQQRGVDSFDQVIKNIKLLKKYGINVRINMTVTNYNSKDLENLYYLVNSLKIETFSVSLVYELRKGEGLRNNTLINNYEKITNKIQSIHNSSESKMNLRIFIPLEIKIKYANKINKDKNKDYIYFNDNILHWTIDGDGNIFNFMDHYIYNDLCIGNIYFDSIDDLKEKSLSIQKKIALIQLDNCKCTYCSLVDKCKGGSYISVYSKINQSGKGCMFNEK